MSINYYIELFESTGRYLPEKRYIYPPGIILFPKELKFDLDFGCSSGFPSQKRRTLGLMKDWRFGNTVFNNALKNLPLLYREVVTVQPVNFINYTYSINYKKKIGDEEKEPIDIVIIWVTLIKLYNLTLPKYRPEGPFLLEKMNILIRATPIAAAMVLWGIPFRQIVYFLSDEKIKPLISLKEKAKSYFHSKDDKNKNFKYQLKKLINTEKNSFHKHLYITLNTFDDISWELYKFNSFRHLVIEGNLGKSLSRLTDTFEYFIPPELD